MRRQRFLLASIPAALAVVSRPQGVLLLVPLGIELWIDLRRRRREGRPLLHLGLAAPVPALALAVAWQVGVGRLYPGGQTALQAAWHKVVVVFGVPLVDEVRHLVNMTPSDVPTILDLLMMLLLLGTIPFMVRRLPWAYVGYAVISLIPMMVTETPLEPITSNGRYTLVLFPVFALPPSQGAAAGSTALSCSRSPPFSCSRRSISCTTVKLAEADHRRARERSR